METHECQFQTFHFRCVSIETYFTRAARDVNAAFRSCARWNKARARVFYSDAGYKSVERAVYSRRLVVEYSRTLTTGGTTPLMEKNHPGMITCLRTNAIHDATSGVGVTPKICPTRFLFFEKKNVVRVRVRVAPVPCEKPELNFGPSCNPRSIFHWNLCATRNWNW